jgi:saccharopine dehydrogenase (NAD+, L-lysine forming)
VLGAEAFDAVPFLDLLKDYGSPWGMTEMTPSS